MSVIGNYSYSTEPTPNSNSLLEALEGYRNVIWDWNGTLLNDVEVIVEIVCHLCERYGATGPTVEHHRTIFTFPISDYYTALGFDPAHHPYAKINQEFYALYSERIKSAPLFPHTFEMLESLTKGADQFVLSALYHPLLIDALHHHRIDHFFRAAYGLDDISIECKVSRGRLLQAEHGLDRSATILVGDTEHDLEVAEALGIDALLVADGHQCFERLSLRHPRTLPSRFTRNFRSGEL